jgi:hypothetical protein
MVHTLLNELLFVHIGRFKQGLYQRSVSKKKMLQLQNKYKVKKILVR